VKPLVVRGDASRLPLPDASVDAIVTDPPYGLEFMGKEWDAPWQRGDDVNADATFGEFHLEDGYRRLPLPSFTDSTNPKCLTCGGTRRGRRDGTARRQVCQCEVGRFPNVRAAEMLAFQAWCTAWAAEALRVAKPGAHLLAFGGTRTYHRLTCAIEDAGWEIRDSIGLLGWVYASGFPKSRNVSADIDAIAGAEREVVGVSVHSHNRSASSYQAGDTAHGYIGRAEGERFVTAPATEDAARWQGWGTALKPAWEPIVVARKPLAATVAGNVLRYGTGALNVNGCRVETGDDLNGGAYKQGRSGRAMAPGGAPRNVADLGEYVQPAGRWPTNLVLVHHPDCEDRCVPGCHVAELDGQSGITSSGRLDRSRITAENGIYGRAPRERTGVYEPNSGGASRFYPVFRFNPKADTWERPTIVRDGAESTRDYGGFKVAQCDTCEVRFPAISGQPCGHDGWSWVEKLKPHQESGVISHPTVKPVDLMRWLVRLVTPPGDLVLDMFAGSGATLQAAQVEGFRSVGVELDPDSVDLIRERLSWPVRIDWDGKFERIRPQPAMSGQLELDGWSA
jgi:DNA modification methylase